MRVAIIVLLALCVFVIACECGRAHKRHRGRNKHLGWKQKARRPVYRPRRPGARRPGGKHHRRRQFHRCLETCSSNCSQVETCKNTTCPAMCDEVRAPGICYKHCSVNVCATNSCVTCLRDCVRGDSPPRCNINACAKVCQAPAPIWNRWNLRCRSCLMRSCRTPSTNDEDDEENEYEEEEEEEEEEDRLPGEDGEEDEEEESEEDDDIESVLGKLLGFIP